VPGIGIAAAHQLQQFLRGRLVAATELVTLLRHGNANPWPFFPGEIGFSDPRRGYVGPGQTFDSRLARSAGPAFCASIDVAVARHRIPLLKPDHNAQLPEKVATPV
jgi:hypothetical protein